MNSRQRVLSALAHKGYDRIPVCYEGTPEIDAQMRETFGLKTHEELLRLVGDDTRQLLARYVGPERRHFADGSWEGVWGERYNLLPFEGAVTPRPYICRLPRSTTRPTCGAICFPPPIGGTFPS